MYTIFIQIFSQVQSIAERGLDANPYSTAVYGILVSILIVISYKLWQQYTEKGEEVIEVAQKAIGAINMVESKLTKLIDETREHNKVVQDLEGRVSSLEEKLDDV